MLPHSFSLGLCSQAVISKAIETLLVQGWKGEPLFLEGEAEETGDDVSWEDEQ